MEVINAPETVEFVNTTINETDLRYILENKLVLRHCKSPQNAIDEVENNKSDSDALAISSLEGLTDFKFKRGIFVLSELDDIEKSLVLQRYNLAVDSFIKDSCCLDINRKQKSAFVLGTSHSHFSHDKDEYYGLGKIGSGNIVDIVDSFVVGDDTGANDKNEFENAVNKYSFQVKNQFVESVRKGILNTNQ